MAKMRISKASVDRTMPSVLGDVIIWDDRVAGFGVKVTPSGSKVYFYRYRISRPGRASQTPPIKYTIGKHGSITPDQARKRAQELAAMVSLGIDPRQQDRDAIAEKDHADQLAREQERTRRDLAFNRIAGLWLKHYATDLGRRKSGVAMARLVVGRYLGPALGDQPMPDISRADLQSIFDAIPTNKRGMRRAVFSYASVLWGWAVRRGHVETNLLTVMDKPPAPAPRDRVLSDVELASVWRATEGVSMVWRAFFRLLILTGQRRGEVSNIRWEELDRNAAIWTIPADRAKNGRAHLVPLSDAALVQIDLVAGGSVWPHLGYVLTTTSRSAISGISKAKASLDASIACLNGNEAIDHWRIHDIRRTLATGLQRLGVRFEVTEAVLNHVSGSKSGVSGVYQRHDWADEKRRALDAWADYVAGLVCSPDTANVSRLKE